MQAEIKAAETRLEFQRRELAAVKEHRRKSAGAATTSWIKQLAYRYRMIKAIQAELRVLWRRWNIQHQYNQRKRDERLRREREREMHWHPDVRRSYAYYI